MGNKGVVIFIPVGKQENKDEFSGRFQREREMSGCLKFMRFKS